MDLQPLLAPGSVALVGASQKEGSLGFDMVRMIIRGGYKGEIYPINPRYEEILGLTCYPDLQSIGKPVDVVVLSVAAKRVIEQAENAVAAGARSLVVFANCVVEGDGEPTIEERLVALCKEAGIPCLGHNAMGYYNNELDLRVCGFIAPDEGMKGNVALISQSGSVLSTLGHNEPQLTFNFMLATGTGQVTSLEDYMFFALDMESTKVLALYMESILNPEKFVAALEYANEKKIPVVAMKVARSALGAEFAKSHTGGLAGNDGAVQAIFDHYGVVRAESLTEMANTLLLLSRYPDFRAPGGLVAIADSGGERNLLADEAEAVGLSFAELPEKIMAELEAIQEYGQHAANPLDPWGTGIDFERIFEDSLVKMLEAGGMGVISQDLRDGYYLSQGCVDALRGAAARSGKPVAFMTNFSGVRRTDMTRQVNEFGAPVLVDTRAALKAVKNFLAIRDFRYEKSEHPAYSLSPESLERLETRKILQEDEALAVLKELGVSVPDIHRINDLAGLEDIKESLEYPLVLKTAAPGILHKSDVGGVRLGISDFGALREAYLEMSARLGEQCLIMPMVPHDVELIFGMKTDPSFGPLAVVGAGGVFTELLRDAAVLPPEASEKEIRQKLEALKTYKLLTGFRGSEPCDIGKLVGEIRNFCGVCSFLSRWVSEIDINPVAVRGDKILALDALFICRDKNGGL